MVHPNSLKNLEPFKPGHDARRNVKGRRPAGAVLREWWSALSHEEDGKARYTQQQIRAFADAADDDANVTPLKRIAARHLLEMGAGGRTGREISSLMFDRTEGRAPNFVTLRQESTDLPPKRIILICQTEAERQEARAELDAQDARAQDARALPSSDDEQAVDDP